MSKATRHSPSRLPAGGMYTCSASASRAHGHAAHIKYIATTPLKLELRGGRYIYKMHLYSMSMIMINASEVKG